MLSLFRNGLFALLLFHHFLALLLIFHLVAVCENGRAHQIVPILGTLQQASFHSLRAPLVLLSTVGTAGRAFALFPFQSSPFDGRIPT